MFFYLYLIFRLRALVSQQNFLPVGDNGLSNRKALSATCFSCIYCSSVVRDHKFDVFYRVPFLDIVQSH